MYSESSFHILSESNDVVLWCLKPESLKKDLGAAVFNNTFFAEKVRRIGGEVRCMKRRD